SHASIKSYISIYWLHVINLLQNNILLVYNIYIYIKYILIYIYIYIYINTILIRTRACVADF
ncbi:MAG: hypothetical protein N7Q72_03510, partial [Spiroplasma sp. Tabriz.8]|nr:hypothetical protein [Spiroplasma sp. Tabriz.8]